MELTDLHFELLKEVLPDAKRSTTEFGIPSIIGTKHGIGFEVFQRSPRNWTIYLMDLDPSKEGALIVGADFRSFRLVREEIGKDLAENRLIKFAKGPELG